MNSTTARTGYRAKRQALSEDIDWILDRLKSLDQWAWSIQEKKNSTTSMVPAMSDAKYQDEMLEINQQRAALDKKLKELWTAYRGM